MNFQISLSGIQFCIISNTVDPVFLVLHALEIEFQFYNPNIIHAQHNSLISCFHQLKVLIVLQNL